ncbi:Unknown protein, partial [Striga hermonthica]
PLSYHTRISRSAVVEQQNLHRPFLWIVMKEKLLYRGGHPRSAVDVRSWIGACHSVTRS